MQDGTPESAEMWRPDDSVEEEKPSWTQRDFLEQVEAQKNPTDDVAPHSIMAQEEQEIIGEIEGRLDEIHCKDEQNNPSLQSVSQPVALATHNITNQHQACQTSEIKHTGTEKQDYGANLPLNETKAKLVPEYHLKVDPDANLQDCSVFPCVYCKKRFISRHGLELHIKTHALATCRAKQFKCRHCRRTFSTQFGRRRHEKKHENRSRQPADHTETTGIASHVVPNSGEPPNTVSLSKVDQGIQNPKTVKFLIASDGKQKDKISKASAPHICKYCEKPFRTYTSLRRHQRRIHERQLLPRKVCKKVTITQESEGQQLVGTAQDSQIASLQCAEDIIREGEFMVDISNNISENLSFYIDGKIVSTSAVSNCEVTEMNSGGSAVIGLNAVIISPAQITQALKLETNTSSLSPDLAGQSSTRRRTSTPPLLPQIKTELETESILTTSSSSLSSLSLSSTSGAALVTTHLPQSVETVALHREKTVYLSPKLKQLLQNQDGSKPAFALITDAHKLVPPLSLTVFPASTTRFKRRTASPPSSPQQSPDLNVENEQKSDSPQANISDFESHDTSAGLDFSVNNEIESLDNSTNNSDDAQMLQMLPLDCSVPRTGGNSCNQQPLDLSNSLGKQDSGEALAESVLDLSISGKSSDCESSGGSCFTQPALRKSKPISSMLQKVLMNDYGGVDLPSVEVPASAGILSAPDIANLAVVTLSDSGPPNPEKLMFELTLPSASIHPNPPLLTPVNIHPVASISPPQGSSSSSSSVVSFLSTPIVEASQEIQTFHPTLLASDTLPPISTENPVHLPQGDLKVTIPDWATPASGGVSHTLIPATPSLSLQGPHWVTEPGVCELAQRTLVVDSVLASEAQIFSPSLSVNQSNVTSLAFPPNTVVIEYTVALESTESILPALQANSAQCLSDKIPVDTTVQQETYAPSQPSQSLGPDIVEMSTPTLATQSPTVSSTDDMLTLTGSTNTGGAESKEEGQDNSICPANADIQTSDHSKQDNKVEDEPSPSHPFCKNFTCNVCDQPFQSMKSLSQHIGEHSKEWPYKCEFCVQLFECDTGLLEHRSSYHGIGKIYVCKTCSKEFAFLCNLEQHQRDLHPGQECSHTEVVHGKLRPENHNSPKTDVIYPGLPITDNKPEFEKTTLKTENNDFDHTTEELYTTIKIMASEGVKPKGPDVRLGINQHYPSFKPPPFPYHNRTPTGTTAASATNFTTHNIPQTFSTAIRCTKCGKSFDNMPELHKHILACANASDKKRYTPKKNPIPLKQFAKAQNGVLSPARTVNSRQNLSLKAGQLKKLNFHELPVKIKMSVQNKRKSQLMQKARPAGVRKGSAQGDLEVYACPHCSREFTYHGSLKKHISFSCPMRPATRKLMKRKLGIGSAQENNGSLRRQTANMSAKAQESNHGPKTIKSQNNELNAANDTTQEIRLKRSTVLATSVVQSSKKGRPIIKGGYMPQMTSKQIVLSSVAQVNPRQPGVRMHVLGRKPEQRRGDIKIEPKGEPPRLRERAGESRRVTRSVQQINTTTTPLKQPESHNIIVRPLVLHVKK